MLLEVTLPKPVHHCFICGTEPGTADVASIFGMGVGASWPISLVDGKGATVLVLNLELTL
jgi:hypothetical protein